MKWRRTKHAGIQVRHKLVGRDRKPCPADEGGRCRCEPSYRYAYRPLLPDGNPLFALRGRRCVPTADSRFLGFGRETPDATARPVTRFYRFLRTGEDVCHQCNVVQSYAGLEFIGSHNDGTPIYRCAGRCLNA